MTTYNCDRCGKKVIHREHFFMVQGTEICSECRDRLIDWLKPVPEIASPSCQPAAQEKKSFSKFSTSTI